MQAARRRALGLGANSMLAVGGALGPVCLLHSFCKVLLQAHAPASGMLLTSKAWGPARAELPALQSRYSAEQHKAEMVSKSCHSMR